MIASNTKSMFTSSSSLSSSYSFPLLVLAAAVVAVVVTSSSSSNTVYVAAVNIAAVEEAAKTNPAFGRSVEHHRQMVASLDLDPHERRALQGGGKNADKPSMDFFDPREDRCDNSDRPTEDRPFLDECEFRRFPDCDDDEDICYNRKPSRDHFHKDNHQHKFYIQYDRVFCYPRTWGGCSSCTPGRYCKSEQRCILEEQYYPCEEWF